MPRKFSVIGCAVVLGIGALASWSQAGEGEIGKARAAVKGLGESLKAQLMAAIKAGGPVPAIAVCRTVAPALADETSKDSGFTVTRTALRVRNPKNAPDAWERKVLEDFVARTAAGADPATLEHSEILSEGGRRTFRYMKAIPTAAEPCLACHGASIEPAVKAQVDKLYPEDQATGFKAGDLRGAFSVRMDASTN